MPNVVAVTDRGIVVLLGPDGLAACGGSVDDLAQAIDDAVVAAALAWQ